jgi:hypothetical protein
MTTQSSPGPWSDGPPKPTLLEQLIRLGSPWLDAETANAEVIRLTVENIKLQAKLDEQEALCPGVF